MKGGDFMKMPKIRWNEKAKQYECQVKRKTLRDSKEEVLIQKILTYMSDQGLGKPEEMQAKTLLLFRPELVPYIEFSIKAKEKKVPVEALLQYIDTYNKEAI